MFWKVLGLVAFAATVSGGTVYMEDIRNNVEAIKTDVATVKTDVATVKTDVATVKTDVATVKTDVATVKTDVATVKTDVATVKTDVATVKSNTEATESNVQALSNFGGQSSFEPPFKWRRGDAPVKMIRKSEGLCYLVFVEGPFEGPGEFASIYTERNFWFLTGSPDGNEITAKAQCWKFPAIQQ